MPGARRSPAKSAAQPLPATPLLHGILVHSCALSLGTCCHPVLGGVLAAQAPGGGSCSRPHVTPWQVDTPAQLSPRAGPALGAPPGPPRPTRPPNRAWQIKSWTSRLGQTGRPRACAPSHPPLCQTLPPRCLLTSVSLSVSVCPSSLCSVEDGANLTASDVMNRVNLGYLQGNSARRPESGI